MKEIEIVNKMIKNENVWKSSLYFKEKAKYICMLTGNRYIVNGIHNPHGHVIYVYIITSLCIDVFKEWFKHNFEREWENKKILFVQCVDLVENDLCEPPHIFHAISSSNSLAFYSKIWNREINYVCDGICHLKFVKNCIFVSLYSDKFLFK